MLNYRPLSIEKAEFRLLTLKSLEYSDSVNADDSQGLLRDHQSTQVCCDLSHHFRPPIPEYTALSYVWGRSKLTKPILVNNTTMQVGVNLEEALRHLRQPRSDVVLWVDALCINQNDGDEKSAQIGGMRNIYAQAATTIVWLGPGDVTSNFSMTTLDTIGKDLCEMNAAEAFVEMAKNSNDENTKLYEESSAKVNHMMTGVLQAQERNALELMAGFREICGLEYWRRTWILQEFAVSANVEIRLGAASVPFAHLRSCMMLMPLLQQHMHAKLFEAVARGEESLNGEPIEDRWIKEFLLPLTSKTQGLFGLRARYQGQLGDSNYERQPLIQQLARAHVIEGDSIRSDCTVPSDRIFGLLGLAVDAEDLKKAGLKVNCMKSAGLVYREAARAMISSGHPDVLSYCQFPKADPWMPSWVPDWRQPIRRPCGEHAWDTAFTASGDVSFEPVTEVGKGTWRELWQAACKYLFPNSSFWVPRSIRMLGARVDALESFGHVWAPGLCGTMGPENYDKISQYLTDIKDLCEKSRLKDSSIYVNPADRDDAFFRIPIADQEMTDKGFKRRATSDCLEGYTRVLRDIQDPESRALNQHNSKFSYFSLMERLHDRRPFLSASGYVGLGPSCLREGDVICIFSGAKLPYILRRRWNGAWSLVGEAYVHGIMYGEFMAKGPRKEIFNIQ